MGRPKKVEQNSPGKQVPAVIHVLKEKQKRPWHAKAIYDQELADEIINRISNGEPLLKICRDEHMPAFPAVYRWQDENPSFAERVARARDLGFEAIAQEAMMIADNPLEGIDLISAPGGETIIRRDAIQRSKLMVETRIKLLMCWNPKKYNPARQNEQNKDDDKTVIIKGGLGDLMPTDLKDTLDADN